MKDRPLTKYELAALFVMYDSQGMWRAEVARKAGVSESYIYQIVKRLKKWGLVKKTDLYYLSLNRPVQKYRLTEIGEEVVEAYRRQEELFIEAA